MLGYWARLDVDLEVIDHDGVFGNGFTYITVGETDSYVEIRGEAIKAEDFNGGVVDPFAFGYDQNLIDTVGSEGT